MFTNGEQVDVIQILNKNHTGNYHEDIERVIKSPNVNDFIKGFRKIKNEYNKKHNKVIHTSNDNIKDMTKHWKYIIWASSKQRVLDRNQKLTRAMVRRQHIEKISIDKHKNYLVRWEQRREQLEKEREEVVKLDRDRQILKFWLLARAK